jgi:hypothetical protein
VTGFFPLLNQGLQSETPEVRKACVLCFVEMKVVAGTDVDLLITQLTRTHQKLVGVYYQRRVGTSAEPTYSALFLNSERCVKFVPRTIIIDLIETLSHEIAGISFTSHLSSFHSCCPVVFHRSAAEITPKHLLAVRIAFVAAHSSHGGGKCCSQTFPFRSLTSGTEIAFRL